MEELLVERVEAVLVDAGGVLTVLNPRLVRSALARAGLDVNQETLDRAHYAAIANFDGSAGGKKDQRAAFYMAYVATAGASKERVAEAVAELDAAMRAASKPWSKIREGLIEGLRAICDAGAKVAIVSNATGKVEEELQALRVCQAGSGYGAAVVAVIDSAVVGVAKPDPRIFELALTAVGVPAERAVHVGDSIRMDVDGARAAGIRPLTSIRTDCAGLTIMSTPARWPRSRGSSSCVDADTELCGRTGATTTAPARRPRSSSTQSGRWRSRCRRPRLDGVPAAP